MYTQKGFTLIELMIVVAIIAILAAIGTVVFQPYIIRTQLTAALADISPGKMLVETVVYENRSASLVTPSSSAVPRTPTAPTLKPNSVNPASVTSAAP